MALSLYVNTFRIVLRVNPADSDSWSHIYGSLCCLRESLMCYACRKLAVNPVRPSPGKCQHNICKRCFGSKAQTKCHCKWCSEFIKYEENAQLRLILQCYKKMCKFIMASGIFRCWRGNKLSSPMLRFVSIVYEGAGVEGKFHYTSKFCNGPLKKTLASTVLSKYGRGNKQSINGPRTVYSIKLNDSKSPTVMIKKSSLKECKQCLNSNYADSDVSSDTSGFERSSIFHDWRSLQKRKSCHCGLATRNPGKLTCMGQRCPCYVTGRPCMNCRCRGCRNPQKKSSSAPKTPNIYSVNDTSPNHNIEIELESFDDTSCSDSDKDSSV